MTLLEWIENHLKERQISATRFGRQAVGDPRFVLDLRNGRKPRRKTVARLESYLIERGVDCRDCVSKPLLVQGVPLDCANGNVVGNDSNALRFRVRTAEARLHALGGEAAWEAGSEGEAR